MIIEIFNKQSVLLSYCYKYCYKYCHKKNYYKFLIFLLTLSIVIGLNFFFTSNAIASLIRLTLKSAIEKGISQSLDIKSQKISDELDELRLKMAQIAAYSPAISLSSSVNVNRTLFQMDSADGSSPIKNADGTKRNMQKENSQIALGVADLNIFNSWRTVDIVKAKKIEFLKNRLNSKQVYRTFVFQIINAYFELAKQKEFVENAKANLKLVQAIHDLAVQKKKSEQSAEGEGVDVLFAKNALIQAKKETKNLMNQYKMAILKFNFLISEPLDQEYIYVTKLDYRSINFDLKSLVQKVDLSESILAKKMDLKSSEIILKNTWKDLLPLPTLSISGYQLGHSFDNSRYSGTISRFSDDPNFDVKMQISWTIPFNGENGPFNFIAVRTAELALFRAKNDLAKNRLSLVTQLVSSYQNIKSQEKQISDLKDALENASKLLDASLQKFIKGEIKREQIKEAVEASLKAKTDYITAIFDHLKSKMELAQSLGEDDLFGDNFFQSE
ncbi:MAG: TolC family protein [Oligoflexia bacterium]|nr:TolC family protein [Oligoflexia bacterium]